MSNSSKRSSGARSRVAITGASGMIGSALVARLEADGHTVLRLVRRAPSGSGEIRWDPSAGTVTPGALEGVDAIVNLAGEPISERWTDAHKRAILESRVQGTSTIVNAISRLTTKPAVLVNGSACGIYGDRGDAWVDEDSAPGKGFLAGVTIAWEEATKAAEDAGVRVVRSRFGIVLSPGGGALARLLPPFQLGAGGKLGNGKQWMSWIALDDVVSALAFALRTDALRGPVNVVAPSPATNAEFSRTLAKVLQRPAVATVPAFAVTLMFGEMAKELLLMGQRVRPRRLEQAGFVFKHHALEEALRFEISRDKASVTASDPIPGTAS